MPYYHAEPAESAEKNRTGWVKSLGDNGLVYFVIPFLGELRELCEKKRSLSSWCSGIGIGRRANTETEATGRLLLEGGARPPSY